MREAGVEPGVLVLDLGAGEGMLTRALADAGAHVHALELDAASLAQLRRRFAGDPRIEVHAADVAAVSLPHEPFSAVANLPFAVGTAVLRRLLDPSAPLQRLDAIVEWGLATKRTAVWPSTRLGCLWGAFHELALVRRVPRACFAPPPSVDAALLRARRRPEPLVPVDRAAEYDSLLGRAFSAQTPLERVLPRAAVRRAAHELGFDPRGHARDLDPAQWAALYALLRPASSRRGGSARARPPSSHR